MGVLLARKPRRQHAAVQRPRHGPYGLPVGGQSALAPEARPVDAPRMRGRRSGRSDVALATLKLGHTFIWLTVESAMAYLLYAGVRRRADRRARPVGARDRGQRQECLGH